jgi:protein-disulfide isomerase/uncharacterized membrane protein
MSRATIAMWLVVPLMLFGLFIGGLMTWHHDTQLYGDAPTGQLIGCTESAEVNCDIVNTSGYSEIGGVPIATLSLPFYASMLVYAVMAARGRRGARALVIFGGVASVAYAGFLFYVSKAELGYVCAWCLRSYGVAGALLALGLVGGKTSLPDRRLQLTAVSVFLGVLLLSVAGERAFRSSLSGGASIPEVAKAGDTRGLDPAGTAPALTFTVTTEDKQEATFSLDPDDAWVGKRDAAVAVVMFGDFECGYCKRSSAELARLEATYGDRVLFVFKHFPMDPACNSGVKNRKHREACGAAKAAVCAQQQGRFWAFHDLAYKNQHQLGEVPLRAYALEAGVDGARYDACLASPDPLAVVRHDAEVGRGLDIHGTPRIFINGKLYRSGTSAEVMARALELALGATAQEAAKAAAGLRDAGATVAAIPADVPEMRTVTHGGKPFRIDTFEAAVVDGAAVSARHQVPAMRASWFEAVAACEKAGKRLCTEAEWVGACQGAAAVDDNANGEFADDMIEGTAYPYGDYHDARRCWDGKEGDEFRPVFTGEHPGCKSADGVYDLTGNVEEWAGDTPEHAILLGGAFDTSEDHARCYRRNGTFGAGYAAPRTGFRCCGD